MRTAVLILFSLLASPVAGVAQLPLQGPAPAVLFGYRQGNLIESVMSASTDSVRQARQSYWKEGAVIGGALGFIGGAVLAHRLCGLANESTNHCTGSTAVGGVLSAVLLAIPGALIGGRFHRTRRQR